MSLPRFLLLLGFATILAWVTFGLVINFIDPGNGDAFSLFLFGGSLFLALSGSIAMVGFFVRLWRGSNAEFVLYRALATSVRQGFLLGGLTVLTLVLQGARLLRWWNALLLIVALALIETLSQQQRKHPHTHAS